MPLEVWGPSGSREDMGTAHFVDHFLKAYNWDYMTRAVKVNPIPGSIIAHEFDYKGDPGPAPAPRACRTSVEAIEGRWKITALDLLQEERTR